jgi:hypothetical protein
MLESVEVTLVSPESPVRPHAWRAPKLSAEGVIEIGNVIEPAIQSNVQHPNLFQQESGGGISKPDAAEILMRCDRREPLKYSNVVIAAQTRFLS